MAAPATDTTTSSPEPVTMIAAVVLNDLPAHLTRTWEYRIPAALTADVRIGCRIKAHLARRSRTGYVTALRPATPNDTALKTLTGLISAQPVLTAETLHLTKAIADRYAGTHADVLRLAVPERRASAEHQPATTPLPITAPPLDAWAPYTHGTAYLRALHTGKQARAVWNTRPGEDWATRLAEAAAATAAGGRSAVLIVPDQIHLELLDTALTTLLGPGRHVTLTANMGATPRYRAYLQALRGDVRIVAGTRSAAYTPVTNLGLVAIWDDGHPAHVEQRAPYPHARDVILTRAHHTGAAVLIAGNARTPQAQLLVDTDWAASLTPTKQGRHELRVLATGTETHLASDGTNARIPTFAWKAAKAALANDHNVLVQVPRAGYLPALACQQCRTRATCPQCGATLARTGPHSPPTCTRCQHTVDDSRCGTCGSRHITARAIGTERTAWELTQSFPSTTVTESTGAHRLHTAPAGPAIVVATPGAEPPTAGGYGAVLLLDTWTLLTRPEWNASEEAVRYWMNAAALAAPDGTVAVVADHALPQVQALLRWDATWFAARELTDRAALGFPPLKRFAAITGPAGAPEQAATALPSSLNAEHFGPFPVDDDTEQILVRVDRQHAAKLARELSALRIQRQLDPGHLQVRIDPLTIA
ncbi:primosome assembly protein PriA [Glycomyces amatae]|uniref:primosomal protein N' family DNA-binding protein n=1 Tax=Glycomyces amatae TaxID=2881355 RepID=UPI00272B88CA|nr:primosome assembly protein PriA [Glycomyces amatae]